MYRDFILQNSQVILLAMFAVFIGIKTILILKLSTEDDFFEPFFRLFFMQGKETLKNSAGRMKKLYIQSNMINRVFYLILFLYLILYFLMASV